MKQISRCQPLRYGAEFSSLAMSGLAFSVAPLTLGIITALKIVIDIAASSPCRWIS